jgi:hypothetical protein
MHGDGVFFSSAHVLCSQMYCGFVVLARRSHCSVLATWCAMFRLSQSCDEDSQNLHSIGFLHSGRTAIVRHNFNTNHQQKHCTKFVSGCSKGAASIFWSIRPSFWPFTLI